jgi:ribosomal-protein-alanine N-acetyltransferase
MEALVTERLLIVPLSHELVLAAIDKNESAFMALGYHTHGLWPHGDLCDALPFFEEMLRDSVGLGVFGPWLIVKSADGAIIGDIGFKGPPDGTGEIEIGFSVIPSEHRKGFCEEAAKALLECASGDPSVNRIIAECLITNIPSRALLAKLDFRETGRDEAMIKWTRSSI